MPKGPSGIQRGFKQGKRGIKSGAFTIRQWKARNAHKHPGGISKASKGSTTWPIGRWAEGTIK